MTDHDGYLQRFLAAAGPRLSWLREQSAQAGGPAAGQLDYSRGSLVPLWRWVMPQLRLRQDGEALEFGSQPVWYGRRERTAELFWAAQTAELMDAVLYYLAECLIRTVDGAHWTVSQDGSYSDGEAVLVLNETPFDLNMYVTTLIGRAMTPGQGTAADLQRQFDILSEVAAGLEKKMGVEMGVAFPQRRWRPQPEVDPALAATWLRPLFPELVLPSAIKPEVQLWYERGRVTAQANIYAGKRGGIRLIHFDASDTDRGAPLAAFEADVTSIIDQLRGLARAAGAQFTIEGEDMTEATPEQIRAFLR